MRGIEPLFAPSFKRRMTGDERAILEDADGTSQHMDVQNTPARRVRHAVQIASDADHAFVRHAAFEPEHRLIRCKRERSQRRRLKDGAKSGSIPRIGKSPGCRDGQARPARP